jgi:predicted AAA+ superfamily ATPase
MQLIGREKEQRELTRLKESSQAEFVVLYGRRRVGKTFLVRSFFDDKFTFYCTGLAKGTRKQQLTNFGKMLSEYSGHTIHPQDWFEAFDALKIIITRSRQRRKVVFLDEVPWMDTQKCEFKQALDLFWNSWAMMQSNLLFIICGSAASWMVKHVINDKGGLHNRLTCKLHLMPFVLKDTKAYLQNQGFRWTD